MIKRWLEKRASRKAVKALLESRYQKAFEHAVAEIGDAPLSETRINEYTDTQGGFAVSAASLARDAWDRFYYFMDEQYGQDAFDYYERFERDLVRWDRARTA